MEHNLVAVQQPHQPHEDTPNEPASQDTPTAEDASGSAPVSTSSTDQPQEAATNEPAAQENSIEDPSSLLDSHPPPKTSRLINVANVLDPAISNNPVLSAAIQVLDQISEVGKVLPFVAPAFVLLKIIIDLEKRATEVDVKCSDLVERITFMYRNVTVPLLEKVKQTPSVVEIVDRMHEATKDSIALIVAYRKQGRVARRLRLSNREKFTTCVDAVNKCSNDLLISLQIHQTVQLDILTRPVPADAGDAAGASFISAHGGSVDAVVRNPELVGEFARQQHLVVDDSVMEQLNTNITESIQQNHAHLESLLRDNINSSIVDGLRNAALNLLSLEAERKFVCVQCEKEFTTRANGPNACSFHSTDSYHTKKNCTIAATVPSRANLDLIAPSTIEWASVLDADLETDSQENASVGQLFGWSREGARVAENTLYIMIGAVWYRGHYFFDTFTTADLRDVNDAIRSSGNTLIFRTSLDAHQYAMGEWVLSDSGRITGIKISAKAATSTHPHVQLCPIDLENCLEDGEVVTISKGGLLSYTPDSPYVLPKPVRVGPALQMEPSRSVRTDFKAVIPPTHLANPNFSPFDSDSFRGTVSLFNNNVSGSSNSVSITSAWALYRLVGDTEYAPVTKLQLLESVDNLLPITIDPRQSWTIKFEVTIPRTEDDQKLQITWKDRAFLARYRPLRVKLILEDVEGETCSLVLEYVFQPSLLTFQKPNSNDIDLLFLDNYITFDRQTVHVSVASSTAAVITIHGTEITPTMLSMAVFQAIQKDVTELDLGIGQELFPGVWAWSAYVLVDLSCQSVYAFKIILHDGQKFPQKHFGAVYYVPCPSYGEPSGEVRPIKYATETVGLPPLVDYAAPVFPQDDDLDDVKQMSPPALNSSSSSSSAPTTEGIQFESTLAELNARLTSVDANLASINTHLSRIALAFEKLVGNMPSPN
ncbi:hypothetical protein BJ912DRAFT_1145985 [Pholiota molesta]|nr:hypothetical protein BJ912DRAFT_1145985 [Pholiota molesta]